MINTDTLITFHKSIKQHKEQGLAYGQAVMHALYDTDPYLYVHITECTNYDTYHKTEMSDIIEALEYIYEEWGYAV